jgi:hypothetical protein
MLFALVCLFLAVGLAFAEKDKNDKGMKKVANVGHMMWFDINNLMFAVQNNGSFSYDPINDHAGFYYPKGTGSSHTAIYQDGLVWGGRVHEDHDSVRVGGSAYIQGLQEGKVIGKQPDDPAKASYRVYKIRSDWQTASEITASERTQYQKDYDEWPKGDGAPVGTDGKPSFVGDQVLWYVANDFNAANTITMYGSPPIGIEQQVTVWGYNQPGALGNLAFKKYIIINKGGKRVDSMYVSQWSDPDNGQSDNDVVGCDSVLGIGYCYNGVAYDAQYGFLSPSAGFDFFQGPRVVSAADSAVWMGKRIQGYKNLGMTSFTLFDRTIAAYSDPAQGSYSGTVQWWNLLKGLMCQTGAPFVDPKTNLPNKFVANGDPVKRTGWVDGSVPVPGDRRMCLNSGPFTLATGDTQEIVVAYVAAQGTDRLSSVALMKFYDQQAQLAYDNFFNVPGPPPPPKVSVAEMDGEIILSWGDPVSATATENYNNGGYAFEGYNVYQLPTPTVKSKDEAKLLQVSDIPGNNVTIIIDKAFDPVSGLVLDKPVQFGTDQGAIQRKYSTTQDWVRGTPLVNNQRYYFAVTAYAFNPSPTAVPNNLENSIVAVSGSDGNVGLVPQGAKPGMRFAAVAGDTLKVTHSAGSSDGTVTPAVINPTALNGHAYDVSFATRKDPADDADKLFWVLKDQGSEVYASPNISGGGFYPDISGFNINVVGPPDGMKSYSYVPSANRWITWSGSDLWALEGFSGAMGWGGNFFGSATLATSCRNVELRFADADVTGAPTDPNDPNVSIAYRYLRAASSAPAKPEFAPFIKVAAGGYPLQDFQYTIPLAAYDIEASPARRLAVGFQENNAAAGIVDGKYMPALLGNTNSREFLYIFDAPYSTTSDPALAKNMSTEVTTVPLMWVSTAGRRSETGVPHKGDVFTIYANHPLSAADKYTFTAAAPTYDAAVAVADVARINVFPNPYFGFNKKETDKAQRFVTFTHLPQTAKIRVFSLSGTLVKTVLKDDPTQYAKWDLRNENGLPVASGIYIVHIDMSGLGMGNKILKVAVIQEAQFLDQVQTGNL